MHYPLRTKHTAATASAGGLSRPDKRQRYSYYVYDNHIQMEGPKLDNRNTTLVDSVEESLIRFFKEQ